VPITPPIHRTLAVNPTSPHHLNEASLFEVEWPLDLSLLRQIARALLVQHDALRLRFVRDAAGWSARIAEPDEKLPVSWMDLTGLTEDEQKCAIEATAAELQTSLNLAEGPLLRLAYFARGADRPGYLLLIIHHFVFDAISLRFILDDIETAYRQLYLGQLPQLPPKTTSFKYWAEQLNDYAQQGLALQELPHWLNAARVQVRPLPVDDLNGENTRQFIRAVNLSLDEQETQALLHTLPARYEVTSYEVLLAALAYAFRQWTGETSLLIDLMDHGRLEMFEAVDLSRTVGYFSSCIPALLPLDEATTNEKLLKSMARYLRSIRNRGIGYGVLRYLGRPEVEEQLAALPQPEVRLNYRGRVHRQLDIAGTFRPVQGISVGPTSDRQSPVRYKVDIVGDITAGNLELMWKYSEKLYRRSTIELLAQTCMDWIRSLSVKCSEGGVYSCSTLNAW